MITLGLANVYWRCFKYLKFIDTFLNLRWLHVRYTTIFGAKDSISTGCWNSDRFTEEGEHLIVPMSIFCHIFHQKVVHRVTNKIHGSKNVTEKYYPVFICVIFDIVFIRIIE